jgi:hypothetical protein
MVSGVVFDVGETLPDDSREWGAWADWVGVPRHTFSTVLGAVTAAGRDNAETFQYFRPGFDLAHERQLREAAGRGEQIDDTDLYPDAELVRVAGSRWGVEETFQFAKNETGLDHYQVHRYDAWYRHITLSMLAAAFLTITAHRERISDQKGVSKTTRTT